MSGRGGGPGEGPPSPGLVATRLARGAVVPAGRAARRSRANVRHPAAAQVPWRSHSPLTACPGPRRAGHGRWQGGDAPSARAASLASSAALPLAPGNGPDPARLGGGDPYVNPYVNPYVIPYALGVRTPHRPEAGSPVVRPPRGASRPQNPRPTSPPRGSGADRPQGALRAIDSSACPRSWRTCGPRRLRRQSQPGLFAT